MRTFFLLWGLLQLCGSTFAQECNSALVINQDFPGSDIQTLSSPDAEHCQQLCTQQPSCSFFVFVGPNCTLDTRCFSCFLKATPSGVPTAQVSKQGATAGYSLRNCNPDLTPCLPQVYKNVNFPGSDYRNFFSPDDKECQRACTSDPSCQFFTFVNGDFSDANYRYKCFLKFSWTIPIPPIVVANANGISGFSQALPPNPPCHKECPATLFPNVDNPGNDLQLLPAVCPEQCQSLCSANPSCTHFTYVSGEFKCYLKNNSASMNPTAAANGVISGMPLRFCQLDNNWIRRVYQGVDFTFSDDRFLLLDNADLCQKNCTGEPACQFYTYGISSKLCFLKRVITLPAPTSVVTLQNVVSGFTLRNCHCCQD